jgi:2-polyprenyl-3-methyl-5-hydroxy-6-metoxy-1,4-benzoquinol methylase
VQPSPATTERVRDHFDAEAGAFDALYNEDRLVQRTLRPGLQRRRQLAIEVVRSYQDPAVLDVGCGSGRIGEGALDAGAAAYLGIDLSEPMLQLARSRLARFESRVTLVQGDFLEVALDGTFDVVIALGLFDYVAEPHLFARRMHEVCAGEVVASFPKWTWLKGPVRKVRYEVVNDCPIFNYTDRELRLMFGAAGFERVQVIQATRSGYLVRAFATPK